MILKNNMAVRPSGQTWDPIYKRVEKNFLASSREGGSLS